MRARWASAALLMVLGTAALHGQTLPAWFPGAGPPPPVNSLAFAIRAPLPGQPDYLQTIKYIDDGLRYVDPLSQFFISPAGEMCFRVKPDYPTVVYDAFYRDWCIVPQTVDRVEAVTNPSLNQVRLWCLRAFPQCVHTLGEVGRIASNVSAPTIDFRQERAALENLVQMMGGNPRFSLPPGSETAGRFR
jgi:hypothetical protein